MASKLHIAMFVTTLCISALDSLANASTESSSIGTTKVEPKTTVSEHTQPPTSSSSQPSATTSSAAPPTTVPSATTQQPSTQSPVLPPKCNIVGQGQYPAKYCNQYYECLERGYTTITRKYRRVLRTCPDDLIYDVSLEACVVGTCNPKSVAPDCRISRRGKFPAENCREYYECSAFFWPWFPLTDYDLVLNACKPDEVFDGHKQKCVKGNCKLIVYQQ